MPKTRDIPQNMREFNTIFERIAYRHDYSYVFNDFLDFLIKGFSPVGDFKELNKYGQSRYTLEERQLFGKLIYEWIRVMNKAIVSDKDYYDALGTYYEVLAGKSKKSAFGQFFTPEHVATLMTLMVSGDETPGKLINEPCSGSGRFILASHVQCPGNYFFAEDLDPVCCKMTVANMCIHGAVGVVINHNTLSRDDFRGAWAVNEVLNNSGMPSIRKISKDEISSFYYRWKPWNDEVYQKQIIENPIPEQPKETPEIKLERVEQLSLFS